MNWLAVEQAHVDAETVCLAELGRRRVAENDPKQPFKSLRYCPSGCDYRRCGENAVGNITRHFKGTLNQ